MSDLLEKLGIGAFKQRLPREGEALPGRAEALPLRKAAGASRNFRPRFTTLTRRTITRNWATFIFSKANSTRPKPPTAQRWNATVRTSTRARIWVNACCG